jgi:hypothetical protein
VISISGNKEKLVKEYGRISPRISSVLFLDYNNKIYFSTVKMQKRRHKIPYVRTKFHEAQKKIYIYTLL